MTEPTIQILFEWRSTMPDLRQYKQNSTILEPVAQMVGVNVPLTLEYIVNSEVIITAQLSAGIEQNPILTPKGMRYCINQLEDVFDSSDAVTYAEDNEFDEGDGFLPSETLKKLQPKDDWGEDACFAAPEDKKEEAWKDTEEDWNG